LNPPIPRLRRVLPRQAGKTTYLVLRRRARRLLILRASDGGT